VRLYAQEQIILLKTTFLKSYLLQFQGWPKRFVSIQSISLIEEVLIGIQLNFRASLVSVGQRTHHVNVSNDQFQKTRFISVVAFFHLNALVYLGIGLDEQLHIMHHSRNIHIEVCLFHYVNFFI